MTTTFFAPNARILEQKLICKIPLPFTLNQDREVTGNGISDINSFSTAEYHFYCYFILLDMHLTGYIASNVKYAILNA